MPVTDASAIADVADTLFRAIEASDVGMIDELWNDDIAVWHSGDQTDNDRARAMRVICWFINRTSTRHYEILDRRLFEGGFVQQHVLHASGERGSIDMRVCIVVRLAENGLISRIDEYFDPAEMAPLLD